MFRRVGLIMASAGALVLTLSAPTSAAALSAIQAGLRNQATGLCLEADRVGEAHTATCNNSRNQTWVESPSKQLSNAATGWCLEADGAGDNNVYATYCTGTPYQTWTLGHGDHTLRNNATGWCLASNTFKQTYTTVCSHTPDLKWNSVNLQRS